MRLLLTLFAWLICITPGSAQANQYRIEGKLENYTQDSIFLGYYHSDKQYLFDTAVVEDGRFVIEGTDTLHDGVYLIVMPPDNKYFQIIVNGEREFSFTGDINALESSLKFVGSKDNTLFYENLAYIGEKRSSATTLNEQLAAASSPQEKEAVQEKIDALNDEVMMFQKEIVDKNPETLTAALIKSGFRIDIPDFEGTEEEIKLKQYKYYKKHYFDYVDLSDNRLIRSPQHVLYDKVNYYLTKLTPQHPDSIIASIDYLLPQLEGDEEIYKIFLIKFLNDYAASKIVGMDAVYVHLALNYYAKGKAPWVEESQLNKIIANARDAEGTLIGKIAPNFTVQLRDSTDISLHDIKSPYTVLVFFAHNCGHCKETMPELNELYPDLKQKGIEVMAVCTKVGSDEPPCWEFVDEYDLEGWINASDKTGGRSFMHSLFNIKKTPKLLVLDENKKILSKELSPEQLLQFFDQILKEEASTN